MLSIVAFIVLIGVLITAHEFGHFAVAKLSGVKVEVFSIGFGSPIFKIQRGETEYRIAWLPVGGYVRLLGAHPDDRPEPEDIGRGVFDKPPWVRILIYAAGPAMNIVLPLAIIAPYVWLSSDFDEVPDNQIGAVDHQMPAYKAGLRDGDAIVGIGDAEIGAFWQIKREIDAYDPEQGALAVTVKRPGVAEPIRYEVTPKEDVRTNPLLGFTSKEYLIGYMPSFLSPDIAVADPQGPAADAGLRTGDKITAIDGAEVTRYVDIEQRLRALTPGATATISVDRTTSIDPQFAFLHRKDTLELRWTAPAAPTDGQPLELGLRHASSCVSSVDPGHPVAKVLQVGDCFLAIDGQDQTLGAFLARRLDNSPEAPKSARIIRGGQTLDIELVQEKQVINDPLAGKIERWQPGFTLPLRGSTVPPQMVENPDRLAHGWYKARDDLAREFEITLRTIAGLFTREVAADQLSGPLTIFYLAGEQARRGLSYYLDLMVLLSLSIGLFNLLPVPLLDGGQILVAGVEMVTRRPLPEKVQLGLQYVGLALILALFLFALVNDAVRMYRISSS